MSNSTNRKNDNQTSQNGDGANKITDFLKKNVKYISGGVVVVALVVVLAMNMGDKKEDSGKQDTKVEQETEKPEEPEVKKDEYEVDVQPEVKELISSYYNAYVAGDIEKLEAATKYLSDMEKSYINMMKEHVESYSDVTCYTKEGQDQGSYMVSATFNMHFNGVEGGLPGMDFFYVRTDEDGKLYIDNRYSSFNRQMEEQETEAEIDALIQAFEEGEDVQQLSADIQKKYDEAVAADENLKNMRETVSNAIKEWKDSYKPEEPKKEEDSKEEDSKKEEASEEDSKKEEQPKEDEQPKEEQENNDQQEAEEEKPQEESTPTVNYVPEGKVLTANSAYNVRKSMNESSELLGTTAPGDSIKVILSYAEGWTKVEWNDKTGYIRTDLLLNN